MGRCVFLAFDLQDFHIFGLHISHSGSWQHGAIVRIPSPTLHLQIESFRLSRRVGFGIPGNVCCHQSEGAVIVFFNSKHRKSTSGIRIVIQVIWRPNIKHWNIAPIVLVCRMRVTMKISHHIVGILGDHRTETVDLRLCPFEGWRRSIMGHKDNLLFRALYILLKVLTKKVQSISRVAQSFFG